MTLVLHGLVLRRLSCDFYGWLVLLSHPLSAGVFGDEGDANEHLEKGKKLLMEGNLSEALMHYSMAVGALRVTLIVG